MKILWISNTLVSDQTISHTGTWLVALYESIMLYAPNLTIINAVPTSGCEKPCEVPNGSINQFLIPKSDKINNQSLHSVYDFIRGLNVDIVHVWGTENGWAYNLLSADIEKPILLEMQGIISTVRDNYWGGLSLFNLLRNITLRDILRYRRSVYNIRVFSDRINKENSIIRESKYIAYQSDWVKDWVEEHNKTAKLYFSRIILRNDFYYSERWEKERCYQKLSVVCISSFDYPLKGGHVLLKAIAILKNKYPNIELRIAGRSVPRWKYSSYDRYIQRQIKKLGIQDNIKWYGPLNSSRLIDLLKDSTVFVCPSYIESYSMVTAEALMIGIPTITSSSGALPEFQKYGSLCFPNGDYLKCAGKIDYIFQNPEFAEEISIQNRDKLIEKYDRAKAVETIYDTYLDIINSSKS